MRRIEIDLTAICDNYRKLKAHFANQQVVAVVKANAYGHGMHEVAHALEQVGVDALATADLEEALELRAAGIQSRLMCWLVLPDDDFQTALEQDVEIGVSNFEVLNALPMGAKIHLKVDTGLGRNGFPRSDWQQVFLAARGKNVVGLFSHLANTSLAEDQKQRASFDDAIAMAKDAGLADFQTHLAASGAGLEYENFPYDMVRIGIALYGQSPFESGGTKNLELVPAMRVTARVAGVKKVPAGQGVSYGYQYVTQSETTLALVPFGYAEGMPRISTGAQVSILGRRYPIVGRIAMDQFVVDVGAAEIAIGEEVVIFGNPAKGEPSVDDLAQSAQSINYEVVTRIGGRANRVYLER